LKCTEGGGWPVKIVVPPSPWNQSELYDTISISQSTISKNTIAPNIRFTEKKRGKILSNIIKLATNFNIIPISIMRTPLILSQLLEVKRRTHLSGSNASYFSV